MTGESNQAALLDARQFAAEMWPDEAWREGVRQRAHRIMESDKVSPHLIVTKGGRRYVPRWVVTRLRDGGGDAAL